MKPSYNGRAIPSDGQAIQYVGGKFIIPDRPIIPFIEGDGTGRDIWPNSRGCEFRKIFPVTTLVKQPCETLIITY